MVTTIQLTEEVKKKLDFLKIHRRETYNELISRLIKSSVPNSIDKESLIATIEVLSDPELMKEIREALAEEGGTPWEEIKKELDLNVSD